MAYMVNFMISVAAILRGGRSNSAGVLQSVYRISSKSGRIRPLYSVYLIFKMVASAILENGPIFSLLRFLSSACVEAFGGL
jgi:hypothetical protein